MKKKINLATSSIAILIIAILVTVFIYIGKNVQDKFKIQSAENLRAMHYKEADDNIENCDYVKFSAFFSRDLDNDNVAEKLLGTCRNVNNTDELYIDVNVLTDGYLEDGGRITINSTNFNYSMNMVKDSVLKNNYVSDDVTEIILNQVNAGTEKIILGDIISNIGKDTNNYSKVNSVTLTATHVSDTGERTEINKTINLEVDWYGDVETDIYTYDAEYNYNNLKSNTITFAFRLDELRKELLLKENVAQITIPQLKGYNATEVTCTNDNVETNYDSEKGILTIKRESKTNEAGVIETGLSRSNTYIINVTYPEEAYNKIESYTLLTFPIEGYYVGYNNGNQEFENPKKSNVKNGSVTVFFNELDLGNVYWFDVELASKQRVTKPNERYVISKQDLLNLYDSEVEDSKFEYKVYWYLGTGSQGKVTSMVLSETKGNTENSYGDSFDNNVMDEYVVNKGIYFSGATQILGTQGKISVYNDDTNALIKEFTIEDWDNYNAGNPFTYEEPIKHIRVETTEAALNSTMTIYHVKELDQKKVTENFKKEDIENIERITTYLTGTANIEGQGSGTDNKTDYAYYVSQKSYAGIRLEEDKLSTQEIHDNQKIYISTQYTQEGDARWKNGEFLVEIPEDIINMDINDVTISNTNVEISAYDLYKDDNGKYFLKIMTKNEEPTTYTITVDCNMTPNPRAPSSNKKLKLYSYNGYCNDYYFTEEDTYDVDKDNVIDEKIGFSDTNMELLSPTSLLTLESISEYNSENEITLAPNVAEVYRENREATINIDLTNNYPNTVSGVQILGKIPFKGNTYILNGKDLNSQFDTTMTSKGIEVPEDLKDKTTVYYSEQESPSKDLFNTDNGWVVKDEVKDFSKIKSYLIDVSEYTIGVSNTYVFKYEIDIPDNVNYGLASYSDHAVYYELSTENGGNLLLSTEPNKVGIRVIKKFNLELTKCKTNSNSLKVGGASYTIEGKDTEGNASTRILTTDSNGNINMTGLYVGYEYVVKEIKSPENYALNSEVIHFKIVQDENGKLKLETDSESHITFDEENEIVKIKVEDEPKYSVTLTKEDSQTGAKLKDVTFSFDGKNYVTDKNGKIILEPLEQDKTYTLKETKSDGYYLPNKEISFKLVKDTNGEYKIESENEEFSSATIVNNDDSDLIKVNVNVKNEKIPTYNLQILKVEENFEEEEIEKLKPLEGAKFKLTSKDTNIQKEYTTDTNGYINVANLYEYVENKYIKGEYVLQEVQSPDGYSNNLEEIEFKVSNDSDGNLQIQIENQENLTSVKQTQIEDDTVKIIIQDKPLFKVIKTDEETGDPLSNAKFIIYEITSEGKVVDYAKDVNENYVGEKDENDQYVVTTNEEGIITLPLKGGIYRILEFEAPEGYEQNFEGETFEIKNGKKVEEDNYNKLEILEIDSIEDLVRLSEATNAGNNYSNTKVKLMKSLDFTESESYENPLDESSYATLKEELTEEGGGSGFIPIGRNSKFSGIFDGQGYTIENLYINNDSGSYYAGLFGNVDNGKIKNITVTGKIIDGGNKENYVGGILGYANRACIINCDNKVDIVCNNDSSNVGGIVGYASSSDINDCCNTGNASDGKYIGGIVGYASSSSISNCYNTGSVSSGVSSTGGIVGYFYNYSSNSSINISSCYNTGSISGERWLCRRNSRIRL